VKRIAITSAEVRQAETLDLGPILVNQPRRAGTGEREAPFIAQPAWRADANNTRLVRPPG
jgi:hypothetical protein